MTNEEREKHLDWLYRLKSEIFVFMPKDWLIPFADALDVAIKALEQEPTTKNCRNCGNFGSHHGICEICKDNKCWTEQEPQSFKWCTDCKEYDQEKHCCHRWSKVIRNTVEEMKQEQEPILDKINKMKSEIADSLEFWDYSPNNNPLARDMLETLTNFLGDMGEVEE